MEPRPIRSNLHDTTRRPPSRGVTDAESDVGLPIPIAAVHQRPTTKATVRRRYPTPSRRRQRATHLPKSQATCSRSTERVRHRNCFRTSLSPAMRGVASETPSREGILIRTVGLSSSRRLWATATQGGTPVPCGRYASLLRSSKGFDRGRALGVTPLDVDLHLVVGAEWPDREDVHPAHTLQVE